MTNRRILPARRRAETFEVAAARNSTVTVGYYDDGTIGELFINAGKSGEAIADLLRDAAVVTSLAWQYGCPINTIRHAITRDMHGAPSSMFGVVLDQLPEQNISHETNRGT